MIEKFQHSWIGRNMTALFEMEKLEKLKKIGVGLLISSLLISFFAPNLVFLFINLILLSFLSIIRFRAVRYSMVILSICSVYFFCLAIILPSSHSYFSLVGVVQFLFMNSGLYLILYSCGVVKENETVQLEKFMKIGIVLLISSLLISLATLNPIFFVINLSLLSLIPIIRFRVARYIAIIIFIYSIYFVILNFPGNMWTVACGIIQILLLGSGLYFILYSYYVDKKNEIKRKDFFSFIKFVCIIAVIAVLTTFVPIIVFFMSGYDYSAEILLAQNNKDFKVSSDVIQIPLNRYLLIKQKGNDNRLCLFCIEEFQPKCFVFNSMLLEKTEANKFKIIDSYKDKKPYPSFIAGGTILYHKFNIIFLPVNSLIPIRSFSYGYCKNGDGDIKLELKDKNVDLPEDKITWFKSKEPDRQTNYK